MKKITDETLYDYDKEYLVTDGKYFAVCSGDGKELSGFIEAIENHIYGGDYTSGDLNITPTHYLELNEKVIKILL